MSEHTIDGVRFGLEMQIEHEPSKANTGYSKAMMSILFDTDRYDKSVSEGQVKIIDDFFDSLSMD